MFLGELDLHCIDFYQNILKLLRHDLFVSKDKKYFENLTIITHRNQNTQHFREFGLRGGLSTIKKQLLALIKTIKKIASAEKFNLVIQLLYFLCR